MNLLRAIGSPRPLSYTRTYNRYTGGMDRRSTADYPPSVFARGYSSAAELEPNTNDEGREWDQTDPRDVEAEEKPSAKQLQIQELEQKIAEMKASWKTNCAETDNLSKRMHREVAQMKESAAEKMAPSLFVVSDAMDVYLSHKPNFDLEEHKSNGEAKGAFDGLEVAKKHFNAAMMGIKLSEIVPKVGDEFDPILHNPCFEVKSTENLKPGQIGAVLKSGWAKDTTLLRLADVAVVAADENAPKEEEKITSNEGQA